jgi:hypothetical protein
LFQDECCEGGVWGGTLNYQTFSVIIGGGSISGILRCASDESISAEVSGGAFALGISAGFISGSQDVIVAEAEKKSHLNGKIGLIIHSAVDVGLPGFDIGSLSNTINLTPMIHSGPLQGELIIIGGFPEGGGLIYGQSPFSPNLGGDDLLDITTNTPPTIGPGGGFGTISWWIDDVFQVLQ